MKRRIISGLLVVVLAFSMVVGNMATSKSNVALADDALDSIKMPIVIYDHLNDGLLFEYDLSTAYNLSLYDSMTELTGQAAGKGLVESELGSNGTPVYKKEVVEKTAEMIKEYIEKDYTVDNDLYNQLVSQMAKKGTDETIMSPDESRVGLEGLGWNFGNLSYKKDAGNMDGWFDASGNEIWYNDGDWLKTNGGADNKAVFDFGTLDKGTYKLTYFAAQNVDVVLTGEGVNQVITSSGTTFTLNSATDVKLTVSSKDDNEGAFVNANLLDSSDKYIYKNFTMQQYLPIRTIGWKYDSASSWSNSGYGGITCENGETSDIYIEREVNAGDTYKLSYMNENGYLDVKVEDETGNVLARGTNSSENDGTVDSFTVPSGVSKIKIVLSLNSNVEENKVVRFDFLHLIAETVATLGNYEKSKTKYENGAKMSDINTCMDYAYYIMNTFWTDTNGDVTQKTDLYNTLTLDNINNKYTFDNGYKINYDFVNGNISQDKNENVNKGFYPLDTTLLGDANDLTAPFGKGSDVNNPYDGENHNYHFAMKAHCEFLYEADKNMVFNFRGDDDVYLFINNKLAMDIGGAHTALEGNVNINDVADELGLEDGKVYSFDFFYMERHTTDSNIKVQTNMILEQADAKPSITYKDENGNVIEDSKLVEVGEDAAIEYKITAGNDNMGNITFNDTALGVTVGKDGINLGNNDVFVKDKLVVSVLDENQNVIETYEIGKDELENADKVDEFAEAIGKIKINKNESVVVDGLYKEVQYDSIIKSELNVSITADTKKYSDDGVIVDVPTAVSVTPVSTNVIPVNTPTAKLGVLLTDKDGNELSDVISEGTQVFVNYELTAQSNDMKSAGIVDSGLGFEINKNGITIPEGYNIDDGLTISLLDENGDELDKVTLSKEDIENNTDKYNKLLEKLGSGWILDKEYVIKVSGLNTEIGSNEINSLAKASLTGPVPDYDKNTGKLSVEWQEVNPVDSANVVTKQNYKVTFNTDGNGTISGDTEQIVKYQDTVSTVPENRANTGYSFIGWTMVEGSSKPVSVDDPSKVEITDNTVFTANYKANTYSYVIKYVDEKGNSIATEETKSASFGTNVTESPKNISGYTTTDGNKTINIKVDGNEIKFVYTKAAKTPKKGVGVKNAHNSKNKSKGSGESNTKKNKKSKANNSSESNTKGASTSTVSPKTGSFLMITLMFALLLAGLGMAVVSFRRIKE